MVVMMIITIIITILFPVSLINLIYMRCAAKSKAHFLIEKWQKIEKERWARIKIMGKNGNM
jgi:uncharacterized membrane protein